ncbi:MAG: DUF481 domain-containing protein [Planctomycetes bacterium]|nr:DUF481 domain-containing protein [Planctomycetota bacterium]
MIKTADARAWWTRSRIAGALTTLLVAQWAATPAAAAKIDAVELVNGDVVTGEIKELQQGKLRYSTDSMGTVSIDWDEITRLTGKAYYRVETARGRFFFGAIDPGAEVATIVVSSRGSPVTLPMTEVVLIRPIEADWREKTDSTLAAGYSYNKSSDVEQYNLAYDAVYVDETFRLNFGIGGRHTDDGEEKTDQARAYTTYRHWLENQNYWLVTGSGERNDELGLDLRLVGGGGVGHRFWRTNTSSTFAETALVLNHTENSDGNADTDFEAMLRGGWEIYIHHTPKRVLDSQLAVFPGISQLGEYRTDFRITYRQELIEDFFWNLGFYHQYDSNVSDQNASSSDYGIDTNLSFEF